MKDNSYLNYLYCLLEFHHHAVGKLMTDVAIGRIVSYGYSEGKVKVEIVKLNDKEFLKFTMDQEGDVYA